MRILKILFITLVLLAPVTGVCTAEVSNPKTWLNVKGFSLENGMQFLVVERPATPQVALRIAIRAGSALEEVGKTGIAHLLEHMMFKGTKNFGTRDVEKDRELQDRIESAYQDILAEERKRHPNRELIKARIAEMEALRRKVQKIFVPQVFSSQLGRNGAVGINAFTSKDQTQYKASVPSDMLEQWFSIISEQLFEPTWREFYVEKEVVQREWAFRYINSPDGAAWLDLNATAYTAHPYRNPTIGWKSDMEKYNTLDAMAFHKKYYHPKNAVVVLVGDVTLEKARNLAKIYFARYPPGRPAPEEVTREPRQQGPRKSVRFLNGARRPVVRIGFHAEPMGTEDFYALDALTMVLSHGRGARITQNILNRGLAVEAWAANPDNRYGGMVVLGGSPNEPDEMKRGDIGEDEKRDLYLKACEGLENILLSEIEKLKTEWVSSRDLKRIRKLNQREFLERMRSNESMAATLASYEVEVGWQYLTTYLEKLAKVSPGDIQRVAKTYFRRENKTSVYIIPGGRSERPGGQYREVRSVGSGAAAKTATPHSFANNSIYPTPDGWKHPLSFQRRPEKVNYPDAETATINGTKVFFLPDRELPLIDLAVLVKAGSVDVSDAKIGLAHLLNGSLIQGGTETYSPSELAMVLDEKAIRMSVTVGEEDAVIRLSVMKDDWENGLALLGEILTRPGFDSKVLDALKQQALTGLKRQGGNAHAVSSREREIWQFRGHPYGRDPLQGLKTIPTITREDLKGFLRTYFVPSNMVVTVAGDIEKPEMLKGLKTFLGSFPRHQAPERKLGDPPKTPPVLALIHKPGQIQSQVGLGLRGIKRSHPLYWKMSLLTSIFGGSDSLIYTRLRNDLGLVYAAGFFQTYKWRAGMLIGYIGCKGDQTAEAIRETLKIMNGLGKDVPEKDLEQKRLDALNSFVFNVDTAAELVAVYGRYHMTGEPLDTLERIQDAFMEAKREELRVLARKYFDPKRIQIFVVGDKTTRVKREEGKEGSLEEALMALAEELGLPYQEIPLR